MLPSKSAKGTIVCCMVWMVTTIAFLFAFVIPFVSAAECSGSQCGVSEASSGWDEWSQGEISSRAVNRTTPTIARKEQPNVGLLKAFYNRDRKANRSPHIMSGLTRQGGSAMPAVECKLTYTGQLVRRLVQVNGTADDVVNMVLCPADSQTVADLELVDSSSDGEVLSVAGGDEQDVSIDRVSSDFSPCHNLTITFSFDKFVGQTNYVLSAQDSTGTKSCDASISFMIVGLTIYSVSGVEPAFGSRESIKTQVPSNNDPSITKTILSGTGNEVRSDYSETLAVPARSLHVKIQYPDGTDSDTKPLVDVMSSLETLGIDAQTDATSPVLFDSTLCATVEISQPAVTALERNSQCAAAFAAAEGIINESPISFMLRYGAYKDGLSQFTFSWETLTVGDQDLADEEYVNVLRIFVDGNAPPIVLDLFPLSPFFRTGGDKIHAVLDNTEGSTRRVLRVGNHIFRELEGSYQKREDGLYSTTFISVQGFGVNLVWRINVAFPNGRSATAISLSSQVENVLSYADEPLAIDTVNPELGNDGDEVVLSGYFDGFRVGRDTHDVYMGTKTLRSLNASLLNSASSTSITLQVPPRALLGAAYDYLFRVTVGGESTNSILFSYALDDLALDLAFSGGSYNEMSEEFEIGGCAISKYTTSLPSGISEPSFYVWTVTDISTASSKDILPNYPEVDARGRSLRLLPKMLEGTERSYLVRVRCTLRGVDLQASVVVRKVSNPRIGVALSKVPSRSTSVPDVPVRLTVVVNSPRSVCYDGSDRIGYEWRFQNQTHVFSYRNLSTETSFSSAFPSRLGREFVIPQSQLRPGNHTVSLRAYMEEDAAVFGTGSTIITILPDPPVLIIGYGASTIVHSTGTDLLMTAENSYNINVDVSGNELAAMFQWTCTFMEALVDFSNKNPCGPDYLPDGNALSFSVQKETLKSVADALRSAGGDGRYFIVYTLTLSASTGVNVTPSKSQIVEITRDDAELAQLNDLQLLNNRGERLDWNAIRYFDDLLVVPTGDQLSWTFEIVSPPSDALLLKELGNLILHPGYFDPRLAVGPLDLPLGIRADVLSPAQKYEVLISLYSQKTGIKQGESRFSLITVDKPILRLIDLPLVFGDPESLFGASATVNLDATNEFRYFFYLVRSDGSEHCLDGCGGAPEIQFRVTEPGSYLLLVRLADVQGKTQFDEAFYPSNISVSSSNFEASVSPSERMAEYKSSLQRAYFEGDHATLEQLVSYLLSFITESKISPAESDSQVLDLAIDGIHQVVQNSAPTARASRSYVETAVRLAALGSDYFSGERAMYTVLSMVDKAVTQVPKSESFNMTQQLLVFYNLSVQHAIQSSASFSSHMSARQVSTDSLIDARGLIVDLYRLQERHLTLVLSRDAQCGAIRRFSSLIGEANELQGIDDNLIEVPELGAGRGEDSFDVLSSYDPWNEKPIYSSFALAVLCDAGEIDVLQGEETEFRWCDDAFTESGHSTALKNGKFDLKRKYLLSVMETLDYVYLSRLGTNERQTDTRFLVHTNISMLRDGGITPLSAMESAGCYTVNTSVSRLGITENRGCYSLEGFSVESFGNPLEARNLSHDMQKDFTSMLTNMSVDGSSTVLLTSSRPGVFGVFGTNCPRNALLPILSLPGRQDKSIVYVLSGGIVAAVVGVLVTWVGTSGAYVSAIGGAAVA